MVKYKNFKDLKGFPQMNKLKRTLAIVLAVATLVMAFSLTSCGKKISEIDVITSEHYTVSAGMITYSLYDSYYYYVNYFGSELLKLYFGIDTTLSLKEQYSDETKKITWFDVFKTDAVDGFCNALALCEAAYRNGVELSDIDKKYVESEIEEIKSMATKNKMDLGEYIEFIYTKGVTEADVRKSLEIYRLANKMRYKDYSEVEVSETEINNYLNQHKNEYLWRDIICFELVLANDSEKNTAIKEYGQRLKNAKTEEEFRSIAAEFLASDVCVDNKKVVMSEKLQNNVEEDTKAAVDEWMFAEGTVIGSTYLHEGNASYVAYMATSEAYLDETPTRKFYTILFTSDIYGTNDEMKTAAEAVYNEWKDSGEDMGKFAQLAEKYTTDTSSVYTGGLYTNISKGDLTDELNDWLFAEEREIGESAIISTSFGYHIMVYAGAGEPAWKVPIIGELTDAKTTDAIQYYAETYKVTVKEGNLKYIK
jgi:parvulin-like peptidyl-prolyl isomerase